MLVHPNDFSTALIEKNSATI